MNPFTLTFLDKNLEKKYKESYSLELSNAFKYTIALMSISNITLSIFWIERNEILIGSMLVAFSCLWTITFYYIRLKQQLTSAVGYLISAFSLLASFYHLIPIYYPDFKDEQYEWIFDISQILGLNFALTPNFVLNQLLQMTYAFLRLFMHNYKNFHSYTFIFLLYLILFWQKEYFRQKHNRSLFLLNEQQKSSFSIWDELIDEKIVLLTYNEQWERVELLHANQSMHKFIQVENKDFLKDFKVINTKISLNQYLLEKVRDKSSNFKIKVIHTQLRERFIVKGLIKKLIDIKITIKFSEGQTFVTQQWNNNSYLKVLQRIKKTNQVLYYKETLRNLLYTSYYIKERIIEQVEVLKYQKLRLFLDQILKKGNIQINFQINKFFTVLPLFFTLISCLIKIYNTNEICLKQESINNIQLIIYGREMDFPIHIQKAYEKIISNLLCQIGQNNCNYQMEFCSLILVNQLEMTPKNDQLVTFSNIM
ncbi:unnamed protein product (macronuclear) [Paramecium tetraurelia]|uniref:Transmembrane protein n=1 Tax=Paramecium tetraurelia TaxID=5888 RepID=A0CE80_PARTE|nr:uncharacterized protein GSPATT00037533001 [Paramecium tetraurelia]CAK69097.1 unnamed protein product [Paramecium tetraurelia]|eukprot:XP_001436494.1 hypothetical protein (macronuclear) [Paramecium tetraurelia strain d4-2]